MLPVAFSPRARTSPTPADFWLIDISRTLAGCAPRARSNGAKLTLWRLPFSAPSHSCCGAFSHVHFQAAEFSISWPMLRGVWRGKARQPCGSPRVGKRKQPAPARSDGFRGWFMRGESHDSVKVFSAHRLIISDNGYRTSFVLGHVEIGDAKGMFPSPYTWQGLMDDFTTHGALQNQKRGSLVQPVPVHRLIYIQLSCNGARCLGCTQHGHGLQEVNTFDKGWHI